MILHWVAPLLEQAGRVGKTQKSWSIQAPTTHLQPPHLTPHPHHSPTLQPPSLNCQYQHVSVLKCISGERVDWSTCSNFYADFTHMQVEHVIISSSLLEGSTVSPIFLLFISWQVFAKYRLLLKDKLTFILISLAKIRTFCISELTNITFSSRVLGPVNTIIRISATT